VTLPGAARILAAAALLATAASEGCATFSSVDRDPAARPRIFSTTATLRDQPFDLHLAVPPHPRAPDVLVLYASGDGGWFGAAIDMFRAVGDAGFYAVGLSTRTLLQRKLSARRAPSVAELAEDYQVILERASAVLQLPPQSRIILTGWSRGASLAVLAGGARHASWNTSGNLSGNLAGVVAIGLAADENLAASSDTDDDPGSPIARDAGSLDMYSLLAQVAPHRCAVIQATGDRYLQASRARELFGPDTDQRRLYQVTAKNHRFSGGAEGFVEALRGALDWIAAPGR
jgi:hypothetical protein